MARWMLLSASAVLVCSPALADPPNASELSPAEAYRHRSFTLVSGMSFAFPVVATATEWTGFDTQFAGSVAGLFGVAADFRVVLSGLLLGGEIGVSLVQGANTVFTHGAYVGWVIPVFRRVAFSGAMHAVVLLPTGAGSSADIQVTGDLMLECFISRQAFIEPVIAVGELQETGFGSSGVGLLVVGVGYRMGIIF
jgi:hypothetical protein